MLKGSMYVNAWVYRSMRSVQLSFPSYLYVYTYACVNMCILSTYSALYVMCVNLCLYVWMGLSMPCSHALFARERNTCWEPWNCSHGMMESSTQMYLNTHTCNTYTHANTRICVSTYTVASFLLSGAHRLLENMKQRTWNDEDINSDMDLLLQKVSQRQNNAPEPIINPPHMT